MIQKIITMHTHLGIGIDYYVQFNVGFTFKSVTSILSDNPPGEEA